MANLVDPKSGKPIFEERAVYEVAGVKIGVFGLTAPDAFRQGRPGAEPDEPAPWQATEPTEVAARQVAALRAEGVDIIVALVSLSERQEEELASKVPGITAILGGAGTRMLQHPEHFGDTYVADAFSKSKYLSVLTLHIREGNSPRGPFADRYQRKGLEDKLRQIEGRMASYERIIERKKAEKAKPPAEADKGAKAPPTGAGRGSAGADFYEQRLVKFREEKAALEKQIAAVEAPDASANFIGYELAPLNRAITDDPAVAKAVAAFIGKHPEKKPGH